MQGASSGLELSEIVLAKHRNPEETEEDTTSASSKDVSSSNVLTESVRLE